VARLLRRAEADAVSLSAGGTNCDSLGGDDAELAGNDTELLSAVGNLVNNAVRYTPDGRRIRSWLVAGATTVAAS
jgi:two-component system phosphate regulon sensor histidine kinase PhoR